MVSNQKITRTTITRVPGSHPTEFRVTAYVEQDGVSKRYPDADYYTTDKADAIATAEAMKRC